MTTAKRPAPAETVDHALAAIERYDRPDLQARLRQAKARLADDHVRVLVVGEFKRGKSMLVNALVGAPAFGRRAADACRVLVRTCDGILAGLTAPAGDGRADAAAALIILQIIRPARSNDRESTGRRPNPSPDLTAR